MVLIEIGLSRVFLIHNKPFTMAKKPIFSPRAIAAPKNNSVNYASKPKKIGAVIKDIMDQQKKETAALAEYMDVTTRTVERWYTWEYLHIEDLMKISEWLGVELLNYYHSNVKPETAETELLKQKLEAAYERIDELENQNGIKDNRITRLEAKLEVFLELEEKRNGKR
jgi:transcriptional regulator with XRE-family HTH domain